MRRLLLALPVSALLLVGCGGDDGDTTANGTSDTTEATSVTDTSAAPDETVADAGAETEEICAQLADLADIDPEALPTQADIERMQAIAATAPAEVAADLVTVAELGQLIADTAPAAQDDPDALAELEAATTSPEVTAAAAALAAYSADQCGLEVPLFSSFTG